ncbi:3-oxoacid CoA-transferase subunit B [Halobacteriovorax sp. GB3]|uniref:3-oxoacid CoA-transferase subunit B n=1 Tax=Halobacteriovorax sp. GB3 TaxID=2719615 RepID=UPI002362E3FC|nr:3-oxoacid CoA-transferase subunit B [Halobacteriovorax sp. GB3]MDD0852695.1 3-oxoacid CoA-transferase subunit B [Halobacteriovorax sp. GB3]
MAWTKEEMADKVLEKISDQSSVNLGIGLPTIVAQRLPEGKTLWIHSENGVLGVKGRPKKDNVSPTLINAGKETITIKEGASFFDSSLSFGMIRGGHIDYSVLGGMEVDTEASLANWMIPGKKLTGMGGAMDLVNGSKTVIIMMTHFSKDGSPKLVKKCDLPLTGKCVVDLVVTDHGIFKPNGNCFEVLELAPGVIESELKLP